MTGNDPSSFHSLTAHHQDDQVETMIMHFSGVRASRDSLACLKNGILLRPFLYFPKAFGKNSLLLKT
jgi:tRNA(Ile)-lysidine synthase TilS/MesJ